MFTGYPNLELIAYIAMQILTTEGNKRPEIDMEVFPQWWGSTCTGFDILKDGSPAIGGCAMTKEYTTIVHELHSDTYLVFFGNHLCYKVTEATDAFYEDLKNKSMASLSFAKKRY